MAVSVAAVLAMLFWIEYGIFTTTGAGMIQGRYFFSVIVATAAICIWAVDEIVRSRPRLRPCPDLALQKP